MFWEHLKSAGQCDDFIKLSYSLMVEQIPSDNMAWLSALHMGQYLQCKTTCNMKYDPKYVEYFSLLYLLFGSSVLNVLRGPGHFGSVVIKENLRSKYDPAASKCNFAVPTVNQLRQVDFGFQKRTSPGIISKSIEICKSTPQKEFVVCFDGMRVSQGSKGKTDGDVDLWGAEGFPTLHTAVQMLERDLLVSNDVVKHVPKMTLELKYLKLEAVLLWMSCLL